MEALVNKLHLIQKYPGKGGWSYVVIEEIAPDNKSKFGWVQVRGFIDDFEIKQYKLMPMGNGKLFLPIKAEIRKKIKKEEGDTVHIQLFLDQTSVELPDELLECLLEYPVAFDYFKTLSQSEQKHYIDWIYASKSLETKERRILKMIDKLQNKQKMYQ